MSKIELNNIKKKFGKIIALDDVSMTVDDKEFFVLFGPAGAGKTTILKTIAGIEFPEQGTVKIADKVVNLVEPADRNVSMVFENYALYPHMTVFDNIASPMRSPRHKKDENYIKSKVQEVADMMGIGHLLERLPSQLSNGQRQRTALGRCLVREPNVFLMDEPLAHLDAKLRHRMRTELKAMQEKFDTTTIYVTHDYTEALSLGDRIAIVNEGKIIQIGTGDEIYYTPKNEFVASLVGEPEINIYEVEVKNTDQGLAISLPVEEKEYLLTVKEDVKNILEKNIKKNKVKIGIRGINIAYEINPEKNYIPGTVYNLEPIGNKSILTISSGDKLLKVVAPNDLNVKLDSNIYFYPDINNVLFFSADSGEFITRHNQSQLLGKG